jgi:hypothetical protein
MAALIVETYRELEHQSSSNIYEGSRLINSGILTAEVAVRHCNAQRLFLSTTFIYIFAKYIIITPFEIVT